MTDPPDELELEKTERIISGKSPRCQDIVGALVDSFERFRRVEEDPIVVGMIKIINHQLGWSELCSPDRRRVNYAGK
jgi:hypothetical protein